MRWVYNDGGRAAAGFKGKHAGDCVCRAICIASGRPYNEVYANLAVGNSTQRRSKREIRRDAPRRAASAGNGINVRRKWFKDYMRELGFTWVPCMTIGSGCKVHLADGELPPGRLVVAVSKHYTAVIDGVINDTHHPDNRNGTRCVYGYWRFDSEAIKAANPRPTD